jgi:uncharacterized protein YggE
VCPDTVMNMTETIITVSGSHEVRHAPQRATISLSLGFDGPKRETVLEQTATLHAEVSARLAELHGAVADAVTRWNAEQVRVWGDRPWNSDGKQLPIVYHAAASVEARFGDFAALASFTDAVALRDGVTVQGISWGLTKATEEELARQAQTGAIRDASAKAQNYAAALGLSAIRAVAVADPGMLSPEPPSPRGGMMMAAAKMFDSSRAQSSPLDLTPADVVVTAAVEARFEARFEATA